MNCCHRAGYRFLGRRARGSLLLIIILMMSGPAYGQIRMRSLDASFELSVSQGIDSERGTLLKVSASIDYRKLVFFKKHGLYEAGYRVYLSIRDKDKKSVKGEVWEEAVTVVSYKDTRSAILKSTVRKDFPIDPGKYKVEVIIEMLASSRKLKRDVDIRIVGEDEGVLQITAPVFSMPGRSELKNKPADGELRFSLCDSLLERFAPIPGSVFLEFNSWIRISFSVIAPASADPESEMDSDNQCLISVRITDSGGRVICYNRRSIDIGSKAYSGFCTDLNVDRFPVGFYTVSVAAELLSKGVKTERSDKFVILLNRGLLREHFSKMIELLSLVADNDELSGLKDAPVHERLQEWNRFWNKRDPAMSAGVNEELSEFLRRLKYTLRFFSKYRPGWETDMGRVYIRLGGPDRVMDRSGVSFSFGSEYQLWYYDSRGIVYIFRNTLHGGEYRLVETRMF